MIHLATKRSIVFQRTAVNDMGRKSFSISFTGFILGIDIISATFQAFGTVLSWIEALKIRATGDVPDIAFCPAKFRALSQNKDGRLEVRVGRCRQFYLKETRTIIQNERQYVI
jgi:hypothetical protein